MAGAGVTPGSFGKIDFVIDEYASWVPGPELRPFVAWATGYRQAGVAPQRHRGLPSPWLTLIVTLDDPLVIESPPDPRQPGAAYDTLLGGLHTSPALITHDGRQSGVQLGLTPLGARRLAGLPAGELAQTDLAATEVLGGFAAELRERVAAERAWDGRFAMIGSLLGRRVRERDTDNRDAIRPEVAYAWRRLRTSHGTVPVSELAAETGWSARYLYSRFRGETGLSPKDAARVFRFSRARRAIARAASLTDRGAAGGRPPASLQSSGTTLADLAADCGYYDQAHLARDFRQLAGCPPSQWLADEFRSFQGMPADLGE
jgi:AraC-like DNA-binding protein